MSSDPASKSDPDYFATLGAGFMSAKMLCVASEVGLFEKLAGGPLTLDELVAKTGLPRRGVRVLAHGMLALDLIELRDGKFGNGPAVVQANLRAIEALLSS